MKETTESDTVENDEEKRPSRIDAARVKRREEINKGNVFGMPGEL